MYFNNTQWKLKFTEKKGIILKRFRYIGCLISTNDKLFGLKLYLWLTTYTVVDLSDWDRLLGNLNVVQWNHVWKKKLYHLNWYMRYVCFTGK